MSTPPVKVELSVEGLEQVKAAFQEVAEASKKTSETAKKASTEFRTLAYRFSATVTAGMALESTLERVASGQMNILEGAIRLIPIFMTLIANIWAVVGAEKARAVAHAVAHALSGPPGWAILAGAAAAAAVGIALTSQIPSGAYEHIPMQQITRQRQVLIFDVHDNRFASDYDADRTGERIVDKLRRAGVI
ncbi:MAG: hypothetical protein HWN68_02270 [Desulfobacterales bacterium]|nr:hypothetical protein [Desulfobacterales bacterium]